MGHGQSKGRHLANSYQKNTVQETNQKAGDEELYVKEFPRVHGNGSVTTTSCLDGTSLCLSGGSTGKLAVFDITGRKLVKRWTAHEKEVTQVIHVGSEPTVFSSSRDKLIKVWKNDHSEQPLQVMSGHTLGVSSIATNKDGSILVSGSRDNSVRLWDIATGSCIKQSTEPRNMVTAVKWIEDSHNIVQTGEDKIMKLWDARSLQIVKTFPIKQYFQTSCDVSAGGLYVLTGSTGFNGNGCEVTTWDVREGKLIKELKGHTQKVSDCSYMTNWSDHAPGSLMVTVSTDCTVKVWSPDVDTCLISEPIPAARELTSVSSFQDGRFVIGTYDYGIHYCKLIDGEQGLKITHLLRF